VAGDRTVLPLPTPQLDKLAQRGLRDNNFHTTAICGPSRAALITGRNHHNAGSGFPAEWATGVARCGIDTFGVGKDAGSPVSKAYKPPFSFNGDMAKVDLALAIPSRATIILARGPHGGQGFHHRRAAADWRHAQPGGVAA
jgi:hypothetical protein